MKEKTEEIDLVGKIAKDSAKELIVGFQDNKEKILEAINDLLERCREDKSRPDAVISFSFSIKANISARVVKTLISFNQPCKIHGQFVIDDPRQGTLPLDTLADEINTEGGAE